VKREGVGDLRLSGLYNINTESVWLPALSLVAGADFPTGPESDGVDPFGTVILQKTIGTSSLMHRVYVNLQGLINTEARPGERHALYKLVVGYSVRHGADTIPLELARDSTAIHPHSGATIGFQFTPGVPWLGRGDYGTSDYSK
jgi:hypothetical protein